MFANVCFDTRMTSYNFSKSLDFHFRNISNTILVSPDNKRISLLFSTTNLNHSFLTKTIIRKKIRTLFWHVKQLHVYDIHVQQKQHMYIYFLACINKIESGVWKIFNSSVVQPSFADPSPFSDHSHKFLVVTQRRFSCIYPFNCKRERNLSFPSRCLT